MTITRQELDFIIQSNPGDFAVYKVENGKPLPLYNSESLSAHSGMSPEEYESITHGDASQLILENDRVMVMTLLNKLLQTKEDTEYTFRIAHNGSQFVWVHGKARYLGEFENCPVIGAIFTDTSGESELLSSLLDNTDGIVYVCDSETWELLYANKRAMDLWGRSKYGGKTCFGFIRGLKEPCPWCSIPKMKDGKIHIDEIYDPGLNMYFRIDCHEMLWRGRKAVSVYSSDVTEAARARKSLKNANDSLKAQIDGIPSGVGVFQFRDGSVSFVTANVIFRRLMGMEDKEVIRDIDSLFAHVHSDDVRLVQEAMIALFSSRHTSSCVHRICGIGGKDVSWIYAKGSAVPQGDGSQLGYVSLTDITAQKESEYAIWKNRRLYETAVEVGNLSVWEYDINAHRITMTENLNTLNNFNALGLPSIIEGVPQTVLTRIDKNDQDNFLKMYAALDRGEEPLPCDFWYDTKFTGGEPRCERITYKLIRDRDGRPLNAYGISENVTAYKMEKERYDRSISELFSSFPNTIGSFRLNLTKNVCGEGRSPFDNILSLQNSGTVDGFFEGVASRLSDIASLAVFREKFSREKLMDAFLCGNSHLSFDYPRFVEKGDVRWTTLNVNVLQNPETGDIEAIVYGIDSDEAIKNARITECITREDYDYIALIDVQKRTIAFRNVSEDTRDVTLSTPDIYDDYCKHALLQAVAGSDHDTFSAAMNLETVISELAQKSVYSFAVSTQDLQGSQYRKQFKFSYLDGTKATILLTRIDVTQLYLQEQERKSDLARAAFAASQANEAKSRFLSGMSHDMRTPLNAIIGFTDLALRHPEEGKNLDYLKKIKSSGDLLLGLINDTLELSKIESGKLSLNLDKFDAAEMFSGVATAVRSSAETKGVALSVSIGELVSGYIRADRLKLQKIVLNLLANSVKFTPQGGKIDLRVDFLVPSVDGMNCRISVSDTGVGIAPEFKDHLFEPFSQERSVEPTEMMGVGLGLSIVKRLVELMHGTIDVKSEKHKGSTFTLFIPLELVDEKDSAPVAVRPERDFTGKNVLVCEDNVMNAEIIRALLEEKNMIVVCAEDGKRGADLFEKSVPGEYSAILMDIRMPGMDGYAATKLIRSSSHPDAQLVPIIAMTADAYDEDVKKCLAGGMVAHIAKPISREFLFKTLSEFCR